MADLDVAAPANSDVLANFPANERDHRSAVLAALTGDAFWGGDSGGTNDAQTVTVDNTGLAYNAGLLIVFKATGSSTTATPTLNVNSLGAKTVQGALVNGQYHLVCYDGSAFRVLTREGGVGVFTEVTLGTGTAEELIDGISPSTVRITIALNNISTNGTSNYILQIGDASSYETTGYSSGVELAGATIDETTGFRLTTAISTSTSLRGTLTLQLMKRSTNSWTLSGNLYDSGGDVIYHAAGSKSLTGDITRIRITTVGGSQTFDAGAASILVE